MSDLDKKEGEVMKACARSACCDCFSGSDASKGIRAKQSEGEVSQKFSAIEAASASSEFLTDGGEEWSEKKQAVGTKITAITPSTNG